MLHINCFRKKNKKTQQTSHLFSACLYTAAKIAQVTPSLPFSLSFSPPPLFLYPFCSHLNALRFPYSFCSREVQHLKSSSVLRGTADCWFPRSPFFSSLFDPPVFIVPPATLFVPPPPFLVFLLRLILKAQQSLSACTEGKSDRVRKKRGGAQLLVCQRKSRPLPIQLMTRRGFIELLLGQ